MVKIQIKKKDLKDKICLLKVMEKTLNQKNINDGILKKQIMSKVIKKTK